MTTLFVDLDFRMLEEACVRLYLLKLARLKVIERLVGEPSPRFSLGVCDLVRVSKV